MGNQVFRVSKPVEYRRAGPTDLVELLPAPGGQPLFVMKWIVEALVYAVASSELVHLSGPTGSAKSSLLESLHLAPANFTAVCGSLGLRAMPLRLFPIEMATYEAPGELYQRRALSGGTTFDEHSRLVQALEEAAAAKGTCYPLIWLREMGRVHSSSVQGGLLNLMTQGDIVLPDGRRIDGQGIAWVADSNYQAEHDSTHTLVTLDDALKRRFSVNLTLDYLSAEQEVVVLSFLFSEWARKAGSSVKPDREVISSVVKLGQVIRRHRAEGNLQTIAPPTIYGYLAFLRMQLALPHLAPQQIAMVTLLGNASVEDRKLIGGVINEVYGLASGADEDAGVAANLF